MLYNNTLNRKPFSAICYNNYGRDVIYTQQWSIDGSNIVEELQKALPTHNQNRIEIEYLDNYYSGNQPIIYRHKDVRPEVNNKICENLAYMLVEAKTADTVGEPIMYVLHGTDEEKAEEVSKLNTFMEMLDKQYFDIALERWRHICGLGYRFVSNSDDEAGFEISTENPATTFVCYYPDDKPAFSCQIRKNANNVTTYFVYSSSEWFVIEDNEIIDRGVNGFGIIPVIEYPNNERRLSDIEITIGITDQINKLASDRANGIEQFVASWIKFINCEIDEAEFAKMRKQGALIVQSTNGTDKSDVEILSNELNQTESQIAASDLYEQMLVIQGLASRQSNASGDTQGAVELRNGHYDAEKRTQLGEPIFKKAERQFLKLILKQLKIKRDFELVLSDIEIHITRSKLDNMQVKAQVLKMLLDCGIKYERAIQIVGLFGDPEQVANESRERMELLYPDTLEKYRELNGDSNETV